MNTQERNQLFDELHDAGYERGAPQPEADNIDRGVCALSACEECGRLGLVYCPFNKLGSYRAFACCPDCGYTEEF